MRKFRDPDADRLYRAVGDYYNAVAEAITGVEHHQSCDRIAVSPDRPCNCGMKLLCDAGNEAYRAFTAQDSTGGRGSVRRERFEASPTEPEILHLRCRGGHVGWSVSASHYRPDAAYVCRVCSGFIDPPHRYDEIQSGEPAAGSTQIESVTNSPVSQEPQGAGQPAHRSGSHECTHKMMDGFTISCQICAEQALKYAFRRGQESMRERAAQIDPYQLHRAGKPYARMISTPQTVIDIMQAGIIDLATEDT